MHGEKILPETLGKTEQHKVLLNQKSQTTLFMSIFRSHQLFCKSSLAVPGRTSFPKNYSTTFNRDRNRTQ